jgi:2-methylcitrate dehydratase PrpD
MLARNGLVAAQLARHFITANDRALEARFGFAEVMGSRPIDESLFTGFGQDWIAAQNTFKPYACGFLIASNTGSLPHVHPMLKSLH